MLTLQKCYEILGVMPDASPQAVRRAYLDLVKRWHPDSQLHGQHSPAEVQDRFLQIQRAYEQIKQHQDSFSDGAVKDVSSVSPVSDDSVKASSTQSVSKNLTAETLYDNATDLGKKGLYREAIAELSLAIRIAPNYARAYKYRGHLNSLLGLEYQADADLNKANILEKLGASAVGKNHADIEALSREYPRAKYRSPFKSRVRLHRHKVSKIQLFWGAALMFILGFVLFQLSADEPKQFFPQPLNIESEALES